MDTIRKAYIKKTYFRHRNIHEFDDYVKPLKQTIILYAFMQYIILISKV